MGFLKSRGWAFNRAGRCVSRERNRYDLKWLHCDNFPNLMNAESVIAFCYMPILALGQTMKCRSRKNVTINRMINSLFVCCYQLHIESLTLHSTYEIVFSTLKVRGYNRWCCLGEIGLLNGTFVNYFTAHWAKPE